MDNFLKTDKGFETTLKLVETINGTKHTTTYNYDDDNRLTVLHKDSIYVTYSYDQYGRVSRTYSPLVNKEYFYVRRK